MKTNEEEREELEDHSKIILQTEQKLTNWRGIRWRRKIC
jgi:hypothetical protein